MRELNDLEWIRAWAPDVEERKSRYEVDAGEVDDELLEVFLAELKRLSTELREGLAAEDHEMIRAAAHSIKGMGGAVGAPELSVLAESIEQLAKRERSAESAGMIDALGSWSDALAGRSAE